MSGIVYNMVITVALNAPKGNDKFIRAAEVVYANMHDNPNFIASAARVTKLNTDLNLLIAAQTTCKIHPHPANTAGRNSKLQTVKADLRSLRNDVQMVADADTVNAKLIIKGAGMFVKNVSPHSRRQNTAVNGVGEGTVILVGIGSRTHDWRVSENGTDWEHLPPSLTAKTTVQNLKPRTDYYFENRRLFSYGRTSEWSPTVKITTK